MPKMKKGALSKAEKFYIDSHLAKKGIEEISEDLRRSVSVIQKYVKTIDFTPSEEEPEVEAEAEEQDGPSPPKAGDLISNVTAGGEDRGVAIMTPAASELGDQNKKRAPGKNPANQRGVFVMNKDKPCK